MLTDCEAQLALLANTSLPFLRSFVSRHRASLFRFLSTVTLRSPHQNKAMEEAIQFLQANEHRSGKYLRTARVEHHRSKPPQIIPLVDLSWMSGTWWRIVTGKAGRQRIPERVDRQHFEACVFTQILWDLKTGDLYVEGSDRYANTWAQGRGYGGIGYYHVSDTYIALFSRFIPCGVHEAIYILDGLLKNDSDIKPVEVTGDIRWNQNRLSICHPT